MAFPENIETLTEAKDIESTDVALLKQYQTAIMDGNFTLANTYLAQINENVKKNFTASRFNEIINLITEIETFYLGLNGVREYIQNQITAKMDIAMYSATTTYSIGNIASNGTKWYVSQQDNNIGQSLTDTTYWLPFLDVQVLTQYPLTAEEPTGQEVGDIYFHLIKTI